MKVGQLKHINEFEYYYDLGTTRSCTLVAEKFNRKPKTVENWCYIEGWQEEVKLRDREALELARQRAVIDKVEAVVDYRKIIKESLLVYVDKLKKGKVDIKSVQDMERLMKLDIGLLESIEESGDGEGINIKMDTDGGGSVDITIARKKLIERLTEKEK